MSLTKRAFVVWGILAAVLPGYLLFFTFVGTYVLFISARAGQFNLSFIMNSPLVFSLTRASNALNVLHSIVFLNLVSLYVFFRVTRGGIKEYLGLKSGAIWKIIALPVVFLLCSSLAVVFMGKLGLLDAFSINYSTYELLMKNIYTVAVYTILIRPLYDGLFVFGFLYKEVASGGVNRGFSYILLLLVYGIVSMPISIGSLVLSAIIGAVYLGVRIRTKSLLTTIGVNMVTNMVVIIVNVVFYY